MEQKNEHIEPEVVLVKVLAGEATPEEQAAFSTWLQESTEHQAMYASYKNIWEGVSVDQVLPINVDAEWEQFNQRISKETPVVTLKKTNIPFLKIAAIIVVVLLSGIGISIWFNLLNVDQFAGVIPIEFKGAAYTDSISSGNDIQTTTLADGSRITMNASAKIAYSKTFKGNKRAVKLEGEAFFEVAPDKTKPFVIDAGGVYVEVLGTSFLVSAESNSDSIVVVVSTGKVAVTDQDDDENTVTLLPGQRAVFYKKDKILDKKENKDENIISWKTGKIIFNDTRLSQIVRTLNKVYKVKILLTNEEIKDCRVTATFSGQPLTSVLNVISATLDVAIIKQGEVYEISGKGCK